MRESRIITYFEAEINGVKITQEPLYHEADWLCTLMEEKFTDNLEEINNTDFVQDLVNNMKTTYYNTDSPVSYKDISSELYACVELAQHFDQLEFRVFNKTWHDINEKIQAGEYQPQPQLAQSIQQEQIQEYATNLPNQNETPDNRNTKKNAFAEQLASKILAELERGTSPWEKPWSSPIPPFNATSGRSYQGANRVVLMFSGFNDPRYMTFNQAKEAGYSIKKGAKGIQLQKYIWEKEQTVVDEKGNPVLGEDGKPQKEKKRLDSPIVNHFTVFNAEQIQGIPELTLDTTQHNWDSNDIAETILVNSGAKIEHRLGDSAYYHKGRDEIVLPQKNQFPSPEAYYGTALHELSHWTGHESRLNRINIKAPFGSEAYAKEELRAEISSMLLKQDLGIEHNTDRHLSYIEGWSNIIKNDPQEIVRACQEANKIRTHILNYAPEHIKEQLLSKQDHAIAAQAEPTVQAPEQKPEIEKFPSKGLER